MHVVATAGHVDHGKSTLVRALTGTDPDRLEEERRRGLSIELGYAWTSLPDVGDVAFVDVPGHERFIATTLAGLGPAPVALLVVAADDPWMPQAAEHVAALDALGVTAAVLAVTRADLADPARALDQALGELAGTSLRGAPAVVVSGRTGLGLDDLRAALGTVLRTAPPPDPGADVRLWVDRRFTVRGAGTVVTGTLPAGRITAGDTLWTGTSSVRVRTVQSLGRPEQSVEGPARVALNVTGDGVGDLDRGGMLLTPDAWQLTGVVDVRTVASRLAPDHAPPPDRPLLHVGSTAVSVHHRPLGAGTARLTLGRPLPLRVGDRALLRDPGSRRLWGVTVLDPAPPPLRRRGAARERAETLTGLLAGGGPDAAAEIERRGLVRADVLRRIGVPAGGASPAPGTVSADGWFLSADRADAAAQHAVDAVTAHDRSTPLDPGIPLAALAERLGLPSVALARAVLRPPLRLDGGRVRLGPAEALPESVERALAALERDWDGDPFAAPSADRLRGLGLDDRALAAAARRGRLVRPAPGIVLPAGADRAAVALLSDLPQPFTVSEARRRLGTTRRVVLPLLAHLDRAGLTRRLPDDRRRVAPAQSFWTGA